MQRALPHYRRAVFAELAQRFRGRLVLAAPSSLPPALTPLGMAPGLPQVQLDVQRITIFGQELFRLSGVASLLEKLRPAAVVVEGNPRIISTWGLPRLCARYGAAAIAWTKFASPGAGLATRKLWTTYARRWQAIVVYGETSKRTALQWGVPEQRIFVAQNAVDIPETSNALAGLRAAATERRLALGLGPIPVIVALGRQVEEKRFDDVIRAFVKVRQNGIEAVLCVVGTGPKEARLRSLARSLCHQTHLDLASIQFVGLVPEGDDALWLAMADVAVFAGAVGLAINVSLAAETPTIIADEQGSDTELLVHGVTGLRFQKGNIVSLANSIQNLVEQPKTGRRLAQRGRQLVLERATIRHMVNGLEAAIRYAARAGHGTSPFANAGKGGRRK